VQARFSGLPSASRIQFVSRQVIDLHQRLDLVYKVTSELQGLRRPAADLPDELRSAVQTLGLGDLVDQLDAVIEQATRDGDLRELARLVGAISTTVAAGDAGLPIPQAQVEAAIVRALVYPRPGGAELVHRLYGHRRQLAPL